MLGVNLKRGLVRATSAGLLLMLVLGLSGCS